jgi:HSP20 family protein
MARTEPTKETEKRASQAQGREGAAEQRGGAIQRDQPRPSLARGGPFGGPAGPFTLMRRMTEDMDRLFNQFFAFEPWIERQGRPMETLRWPEIEVSQRGNKLVVRADVPGLNKEDVSVEVRDDELWISGERRSEAEEREGEFYRSERSYGSFCRRIPLPEGAKVDSASASFDKGVLEVEMEIPAQQERGRKIEVRESPSH